MPEFQHNITVSSQKYGSVMINFIEDWCVMTKMALMGGVCGDNLSALFFICCFFNSLFSSCTHSEKQFFMEGG
ncbi:hypothetical protein [Bartonella sp. CB169]|uniref:hypothetical protein n=1 Tax=Bartonella sp. CB169 TaxID=3112257 RepID=UPI00300E4D1B